MKINQKTKLSAIQSAFSKKFPHLRIEFYRAQHKAGEGTANQAKLDPQQSVGEAGTTVKEGVLDMDGQQQISTFESMCHQHFGLNVQVFRRSANLWLQTTTTDGWTLAEANRKGGHSRQLFEETYRPND